MTQRRTFCHHWALEHRTETIASSERARVRLRPVLQGLTKVLKELASKLVLVRIRSVHLGMIRETRLLKSGAY